MKHAASCAGNGTASTTSRAPESEVETPKGAHAVGLLPPQLDRPRARRRPADLRAQHLGRLPARRARSGQILWRLGGTSSSFKMGAGHDDGLAARRPHAARRRDHVLRRRLQSADPRPVARAAHRARHAQPHRTPAVRLHPPRPAAARGQPGQHADAPERQRAASAMAACRRSASTRATARCCSTPTCPSTCPSTAPSASPGRDARRPRRRSLASAQQHRRRDDRARQLERRHGGRRLARAGRRGARVAEGRAATMPRDRASRARSTLPKTLRATSPSRRSTRPGACSASSATVGVGSYAASLKGAHA